MVFLQNIGTKFLFANLLYFYFENIAIWSNISLFAADETRNPKRYQLIYSHRCNDDNIVLYNYNVGEHLNG